jgi:molybdate transport system substrate-binding protein
VRRGLGLLLSLGILGSACSGGGHRITVLAASSLTDAFGVIAQEFEHAHPGTTVRLSFGPSDGLAQEIQAGNPVDVFASASEGVMDAVAAHPGVTGRSDFARNRLVVVVPSTNPAHIHSIGDLAHPGVKLVLAAPGVPAGDYARVILRNAGILKAALANVVSNEIDVRSVLAKLASGDADAGIVYVTDAATGGTGIVAIPIPAKLNVTATYPIAVVRGAPDAATASAFVRFVLGPGQVTLRQAGFLPAGR